MIAFCVSYFHHSFHFPYNYIFCLQKRSIWKQPNFDVAKKTFLAHDGFVFYYPSFHSSSVLEIKSAPVIKLYYGNCRAFHAASFDKFYFCKKSEMSDENMRYKTRPFIMAHPLFFLFVEMRKQKDKRIETHSFFYLLNDRVMQRCFLLFSRPLRG